MMTNAKEAISLLFIIFGFAILMSSCNRQEELSMIDTPINDRGWTYGEKYNYARILYFNFRIVVDGEAVIVLQGDRDSFVQIRILPSASLYDPFYTNIIFVHNEQEALDGDFPDNVILAWPRGDNDWAQRLVGWMNYFIENPLTDHAGRQRRTFDLEEFNLTYPITVENLVDNWEDVWRLWHAFDSGEQSRILSRTQSGAILPAQQ